MRIACDTDKSAKMAADAVAALIAISEALEFPIPKSSSRKTLGGSSFGPWLHDIRWIPRSHGTLGASKKKRSRKQKSDTPRKSPIFEQTGFSNFKSKSPDGTGNSLYPPVPYTMERTNSPRQNQAKTSDRKVKISSSISNKEPATPQNYPQEQTNLMQQRSLTELTASDVAKRQGPEYAGGRSALPALITLTSESIDHQRSFGLGKQLDFTHKPPLISVPTTSNEQRASTSAPLVRTSLIKGSSGNETIPKIESDVIAKALAKRGSIPPTHEYEDISQHMKHYRMNFTVMGTGSSSLANLDPRPEAPPVQWSDIFPNRPLSSAVHRKHIPVFRFSVADFRAETTGILPPATPPPSVISEYEFHQNDPFAVGDDDFLEPEWKSTRVEDESESRNGPRQGVDMDGRINVVANSTPPTPHKTTYTLYNDSIKTLKHENTVEDRGNDYREFLRRKEKERKGEEPSNYRYDTTGMGRDKLTEENGPDSISEHFKTLKSGERHHGLAGLRRAAILSPLRDQQKIWDEVDEGDRRFSQRGAWDGGSFNGQRFPSSYYQRRILTSLPEERFYNVAPSLVVDAHRLEESVEDKIREGERKLTQTIYKSKRQGEKYVHYRVNDGKSLLRKPCAKEGDSGVIKGGVGDSGGKTGKSASGKYSRLAERSGVVGLVTAYDFKGYISSIKPEKKASQGVVGKQENVSVEEGREGSALKREDSMVLVGSRKHWRPSESRADKQRPRNQNEDGEEDNEAGNDRDSRNVQTERGNPHLPGKPQGAGNPHGAGNLHGSGNPHVWGNSRVTGNPQLSRTTNSASLLRFKPTSPASSAFVIAAPAVPRIDTHSVVMPLHEFMQVAMDGHEKSFADWSNSMNEAAKIGPSKSRRGNNRYGDVGLLRVVSFATPVNQFIFAKRVTGGSADNVPDADSQSSNIFRARMKKKPKKYRLRLQDFGVTSKEKKDAEKREHKDNTKDDNERVDRGVSGNTQKQSEENCVAKSETSNISQHRKIDSMSESESGAAREQRGKLHSNNDVLEVNEAGNIPEDKDIKTEGATIASKNDIKTNTISSDSLNEEAFSTFLRTSSARSDFHEYLRGQVLERLRQRRARSAAELPTPRNPQGVDDPYLELTDAQEGRGAEQQQGDHVPSNGVDFECVSPNKSRRKKVTHLRFRKTQGTCTIKPDSSIFWSPSVGSDTVTSLTRADCTSLTSMSITPLPLADGASSSIADEMSFSGADVASKGTVNNPNESRPFAIMSNKEIVTETVGAAAGTKAETKKDGVVMKRSSAAVGTARAVHVRTRNSLPPSAKSGYINNSSSDNNDISNVNSNNNNNNNKNSSYNNNRPSNKNNSNSNNNNNSNSNSSNTNSSKGNNSSSDSTNRPLKVVRFASDFSGYLSP